MKKNLLFLIIFFFFSSQIYSQSSSQGKKPESSGGVVLSFITVNAYGNNLYIDNVTAGKQFTNDIFVSSIDNIKSDTSYTIGSASFVTAPKVTVTNIGRAAVSTPFNVTMSVSPGGYSSIKQVAQLSAGGSYQITFDNLTITPGTPYNINVTSSYSLDENPTNNQINQYTLILPGVARKVLLEQWTSSTCAPCASNNPTIDAFVENKWDSLVAVKYHVGWPSPGNDPMYLHNPTQSYDRRYYYGVNSVPHVVMDGVIDPDYPYSNAPSLPSAFNKRSPIGSPVSISVTDVRIPGDSIRTTVSLTVHAPLMHGNYKLRVMAVERIVSYATAPGSNGEKTFYDVFRRSYPNSTGTDINTSTGTHTYTFTYGVDKVVWVDSMIYTAAFVQNDLTKEILNCGKARSHAERNIFTQTPSVINSKIRSFADDNYNGLPSVITGRFAESLAGFNVEFFETGFPPAGWRLVNPDGGITFESYTGANGPGFGGSKSVRMNFYSYSSNGRKDTLYSRPFYNLEKTDSVKFDWAYAVYTGYADSLIVKLSTDGGLTFPYEIFRKGGSSLATAPATTNSFVPNSSQWHTFVYPLAGTNVPVELTSFNAAVADGNVELNWSTASEVNNRGFEIERSFDGNNFTSIGFVEGRGTSAESFSYKFTDNPGIESRMTVYYRLRQFDYDGTSEYSNTLSVLFELPARFNLEQNYPNPFNPATMIKYSVAQSSPVTLKVYDIAGSEVAVLVNETQSAGNYEVKLDASHLASGIYFYKLTAGSFTSIKKMSIIK